MVSDMVKVAPIPFDIILITHGKMEYTIKAIKALFNFTKTPFHLIIVDDSTPDMDEGTDLTPQWIEKFQKTHSNVTLVHSTTPYKEGNQIFNIGLKYAKHDFVATVMNSVTVEPEWERVALQFLKEHEDVAVVGLKNLVPLDGRIEAGATFFSNEGLPLDVYQNHPGHRFSSLVECEAVPWSLAILRKKAVVGNIPEGVYNGFKGWDDLDNCMVVREKGWKVYYCGYGAGYHDTRATRASDTTSNLNLNKQNAEIFYKRWGFWDKYLATTAPDSRAQYGGNGYNDNGYNKALLVASAIPEVIDIILLTHNKLDNTKRCMEALYKNTKKAFKLTVIDDSTDDTAGYFIELGKEKGNVSYLRPNVLIKSGNQVINLGMKVTQSNPFIFLTNSTFVEEGWLDKALELMAQDSKMGVVGFKVVSPVTDKIICAGRQGVGAPKEQYTYAKEVEAVAWAAVLLRREALPEGGLDENFYIGFRGVDDTDNCLEIHKRGWKIWYNGYGTVYHEPTSSANEKNYAQTEENIRRFNQKWHGVKQPTLAGENKQEVTLEV